MIGALRSVVTSKSMFFPNDNDSLAAKTLLSFTLARPMTVTWTLRNASGATVRTRLAAVGEAAGTYGWWFDGRATDGTMLPRGRYTSFVTATDGTLTASQTTSFLMDAFAVSPSDTTPARGQSITIHITSAETLGSRPTLWINQPGLAPWSVRATKTGTYTYSATIRLKSTGRAGTVGFRVWGRDSKGGAQQTTASFALH